MTWKLGHAIVGAQVVMPRNAAEAKGLLLASVREPDPVIFLEPKVLYRTSVEDVPDGDYEVPLGTADVMRTGTDVTLVRTTLSNVYPLGCKPPCASSRWQVLFLRVARTSAIDHYTFPRSPPPG